MIIKGPLSKATVDEHWNYLISLDADVLRLSRYIELSVANSACYSIEITRILLAAASEIDVVAKVLSQKVNPTLQPRDIHGYRKAIVPKLPGLPGMAVVLPRHGLTFTPWEEWKKPKGLPLWWTAYNKVKHERNAHFPQANLENALNAVGGLFLLNLYLKRNEAFLSDLVPSPQLLRLDSLHHGGMTVGGYEISISYKLD